MSISLKKGERISLEKVSPGLTKTFVGLGWSLRNTDGAAFDLDTSVFLLGANDKLLSDKHLIFYNNLISPDPNRFVQHTGDNLTGAGAGDDEMIKVDLSQVPPEIEKIVFVVTIHEAEQRKQNFGQVQEAFVRLVDEVKQEEVARYDLSEDYSTETAMVMAELYLKDKEWRLNAVGSGYEGGLQALLNRYQ